MHYFSSFPELITENLILRRLKPSDRNDLFAIRSNPSMHRYTDTVPDGEISQTDAYIDKMLDGVDTGKWIIWAIEHKPTRKVIGSVSIWNIDEVQMTGELGYGIIPDYQSKGLMKESLMRVIDYGFHSMRLHALLAYTEESNLQSIKLLQRCGFQYTDRIDEPGSRNDKIYRMDVYRLESDID